MPGPGTFSPNLTLPGPNPGIPPGTAPLPPEEALLRLALSLGLPPEELSTALLGFVRYFSLPLDPGLLHRLRREALHSAAKPETLALAAAAAAAKGLGLSGEALEAYAAAIDPGYRDPPEREGGQNSGRRQNAEDNPPEPGEIKKAAEESEAASPLLRIMNRLPGKNQERWVTLPFEFLSGGVKFKVSLRILLKSRGLYGYEAERFALDISLVSRRWLFVLDRHQETAPRLDVYITPPPEGKGSLALERELEEILGHMGGNLRVNVSEKMPFFADSRDQTLLSVNEEV
jgi:hypothetical protein